MTEASTRREFCSRRNFGSGGFAPLTLEEDCLTVSYRVMLALVGVLAEDYETLLSARSLITDYSSGCACVVITLSLSRFVLTYCYTNYSGLHEFTDRSARQIQLSILIVRSVAAWRQMVKLIKRQWDGNYLRSRLTSFACPSREFNSHTWLVESVCRLCKHSTMFQY